MYNNDYMNTLFQQESEKNFKESNIEQISDRHHQCKLAGDKVGDIFLYRVQRGDTIPSIARMYHTDPQMIAGLNGIHYQMMIQPGQNLFIPVLYKQYYNCNRDVKPNGYGLYF